MIRRLERSSPLWALYGPIAFDPGLQHIAISRSRARPSRVVDQCSTHIAWPMRYQLAGVAPLPLPGCSQCRPPPLYPAGAEATWSFPVSRRGRTQRCGGARGAWAVFGVTRRNALDIVTGDEPAPAQQVEGGRVGVREQCGERQLAPCSAELLRGLDGGVGLHCGTGHRGVPGRGSDRGRAGRAAAHGAVGGGGAIGRAIGGSGTPRTSPGPGVHAFVASLPGRPASSSLSTNQC